MEIFTSLKLGIILLVKTVIVIPISITLNVLSSSKKAPILLLLCYGHPNYYFFPIRYILFNHLDCHLACITFLTLSQSFYLSVYLWVFSLSFPFSISFTISLSLFVYLVVYHFVYPIVYHFVYPIDYHFVYSFVNILVYFCISFCFTNSLCCSYFSFASKRFLFPLQQYFSSPPLSLSLYLIILH
jgi:hypothetical protein